MFHFLKSSIAIVLLFGVINISLASEERPIAPISVSLSDILDNPKLYDRKKIDTVGFLSTGFENDFLKEKETRSRKITISFQFLHNLQKPLRKGELKELKGKKVRLVGWFKVSPNIGKADFFGGNGLTISHLEVIELVDEK